MHKNTANTQLNEVASEAYNAYSQHQDWTAYNGKAMPQWDELREDIRDAWEAAVSKVAELT